jgi:hypothetical protein
MPKRGKLFPGQGRVFVGMPRILSLLRYQKHTRFSGHWQGFSQLASGFASLTLVQVRADESGLAFVEDAAILIHAGSRKKDLR